MFNCRSKKGRKKGLRKFYSIKAITLFRWGFGQREVVCGKWEMSREPDQLYSSSNWLVETAKHPAMESGPLTRLKATFWESFIHSHKLMFSMNKNMGKHGK
jgi:dolichyl-phosphate-mannose--protein O-mannosyl transferase